MDNSKCTFGHMQDLVRRRSSKQVRSCRPENNESTEEEETKEDDRKLWRRCKVSSCREFLLRNIGILRKLVWMAAVAVCCYFVVGQVEECLSKLKNPPIIAQTKIQFEEALTYPAVTFCFKNRDEQGYDVKILQYYNISNYWIQFASGNYFNSYWKGFNFSHNPVSQVWEDATYMISSMHLGLTPANLANSLTATKPEADADQACEMPGRSQIKVVGQTLNRIPMTAHGVIRSSRYFHEHGACSTFRPPIDAKKPVPGERHGYKISFEMWPGNEHMLPGGWDIFIHDPDEFWAENPLMSYRGEQLHVPTGQHVHIKLRKSVFTSLSTEEYPCVTDHTGMSYTECLERCRWQIISEQPHIQCTLPFMEMPGFEECATYDTTIAAMDMYRQWTDPTSRQECRAKCVKACTITIFDSQITHQVDSSNSFISQFHIYFPSGVSEHLKEGWGYDKTMFLADFGGSLGFLLGVSILSILEIIEAISLTSYRLFLRWKTKRKSTMTPTDNDQDSIVKISQ